MSIQGLSTRQVATPEQLFFIGKTLLDNQVKAGKIKDTEKVFPQLNREKSLFAYACLELFQGKQNLSENEMQQAREYVRTYNDGFKQLYAFILDQDANMRQAIQEERFNTTQFFELSNQELTLSNGEKYALAFKRYVVDKATSNPKTITSIVFLPAKKKTQSAKTEVPEEIVM